MWQIYETWQQAHILYAYKNIFVGFCGAEARILRMTKLSLFLPSRYAFLKLEMMLIIIIYTGMKLTN